ncbi:hypothetical protein L1887_23407 [Cichorium endivia]|nr:hypothetical protein L1887_23407 [Cichorium endivia]
MRPLVLFSLSLSLAFFYFCRERSRKIGYILAKFIDLGHRLGELVSGNPKSSLLITLVYANNCSGPRAIEKP